MKAKTTDIKTALVTGGSRGIGFAIARKLAEVGYKVTITGKNRERLKESAKKIGASAYIVGDHTESLANIDITPDILINNAGEYLWGPIEKADPNAIERAVKLNLTVPIELCGMVVPKMKEKKWGRIINIGSISGAVGEANASVYSATKAGLIGLSKSLALELAEHGITVNVINPGWVKTDLSADFLDTETLETIPQKRFIEPDEVAGLVLYLVSDEASSITGQCLNMCCGLSLG